MSDLTSADIAKARADFNARAAKLRARIAEVPAALAAAAAARATTSTPVPTVRPTMTTATTGLTNGARVASPTQTRLPIGSTVKHAPGAFRTNASFPDRYIAAIVAEGWAVDFNAATGPALVNGKARLSLDAIKYNMLAFFASQGYHASPEVFANIASTITLDAVSRLPQASAALLS